MARDLPDYDNPPAVETVLGVRFSSIERWNVFHYGLLLSKFKDEYPKQELHPPLGEVTFQFSPTGPLADVPVRCWFINRDDTQLVQIQNNCFIRNWRRTEQTPNYLHYDVIRPLFQRDWKLFQEFLKEQDLRSPTLWQCEVSYINHFVRGRDWNEYKDLHKLYPAWKGMSSESFFSQPQNIAFSASYGLGNGSSLQFVSQPAIRRADGAEIIQLSITALGKPAGSEEADILRLLDQGRESVVRGFAEFLDETAQTRWGRK
jgi:uncharacterized protein (TIGR04255 family)